MIDKPTRQYLVLGFLLVWAFVAQLTYSGFLLYQQANASRHAEVPFDLHLFSKVIDEVGSEYQSSGLHQGDDILALDGQAVNGNLQLDLVRFASNPGETLTVRVRRTSNGHSQILNIPVKLQAATTRWTETIVLSVFLPVSCLLVGFYIAFARPRDPIAWITMAMLASFGQAVGSGVSWAIPSPWRGIHFVYYNTLNNSWPLWLLLFAIYFPVPYAFWKRHSWLNWLLAAPTIFLAALYMYGCARAGAHLDELGWLSDFLRMANPYVHVFFTFYVTAFFFLLGAKRRQIKAPDARRRLQVMTAGCTAALLPLLPVVFLNLPVWLKTLCLLMVVFFPLTMAYVIVVRRAMDVRMVVRSGVQYAVASQGLKVLRVVLISSLALVTIELEQQSAHRWEGILIAAAGVILIISVGRMARHGSQWMDRRFFREAYNAELILTDLGSSVAGIRDVKTLLQTVAQRISVSMHVERIAFLLNQGQRYEPAYALGFENAVPTLPRDSVTIKTLRQIGSASKVYFDDPQSWIYGTPDEEQGILRRLQAQLLLPVLLNSRVLGVICLGAKKSEEPYSQGDLQLLSAVASQTGLALENAELTESIRKEIAQRERLDRELEIARDVQQHLFPQILPHVEGLDFAGYCRPAQGVGGDYYDFVRLPQECLGIAVGDVSGKGIAAALMMASLQASLRGQTIKPCESLAEMIQNINRLVYDASANNRYATFFYAQYEPNCQRLRYVNAGHNAPLLYRNGKGQASVLRLEEGGTVVGLFPEFPFQEGRVNLEKGDILVAFTDGISEALNSVEEEFSEERLIKVVRESEEKRTAASLISDILERVDRFTASAPQHDDMTLVVVRVQ